MNNTEDLNALLSSPIPEVVTARTLGLFKGTCIKLL